MALPKYNLTDDEVKRAELMSLRIMLAVIIHHLVQGHPDEEKVYAQLEGAVPQIVADIPIQAVPAERQQTWRNLVGERARALLRQAKSIRSGPEIGRPQ